MSKVKARKNSGHPGKNGQQYSITNAHGFTEASASFIYRKLEIFFSTMRYKDKNSDLNKVRIFSHSPTCPVNTYTHLVAEVDSVEEAIKFINEKVYENV